MIPVDVGITPPPGWKAVIFAKDQPQYIPLPTLRCIDGRVLSRWQPSPEERAAIAAGADVFLTTLTFGQPLQPVLLTIGTAPVEPIY